MVTNVSVPPISSEAVGRTRLSSHAEAAQWMGAEATAPAVQGAYR
jgi:hypothetical protein